ncbi:MAG: hypothetical protein K2M37_06450 [Muribaculaceae bacterium]|nr:hypothetical protein [Muribaculaceae bacterium]
MNRQSENKRKSTRSISSVRCWWMWLLMLIFGSSVVEAKEIFEELAELPHVSSSYVSGRFAHNQPFWQSSDFIHSFNLSKGFSSLYTYSCNSSESVNRAEKIIRSDIENNSNFILMNRVKDGMTDYRIYELINSEGKILKLVIWNKIANNAAEIVIVNYNFGLDPTPPTYPQDK